MSHHAAPAILTPRLTLGKVRITTAAIAALEATTTEGVLLLHRHLHGDWGDIPAQDALQNDIALLLGMRVCSRHTLAQDIEIWIITEADRTMTTIMALDTGFARNSGSDRATPGE
ncbi:hypothetical protein [Castellaniella sp.]|uniref:hypothetical protein n=1 Tax=Castellaniella sp. TaxID=1955812 RepID=UPI003C762891